MSDRYKILGQVSQSGTDTFAYETLYQVPSPAAVTVGAVEVAPKATSQLVQTLVTSIYVVNKLNATFTWLQLQSGEDGSSAYQLLSFNSTDANETKMLSLGLTLSSGDILRCLTWGFLSNPPYEVDWTCFGVETVSGSGPSV